MARISSNGIIEINRGDTAEFPVYVNIGSTVDPILYQLKPGDFLYFAVMEPHQRWEDALIKKTLDYNDFDMEHFCVNVLFIMDDTEYLRPGNYYYQVKLFRSHDNCDDKRDHTETIINKTKFVILD